MRKGQRNAVFIIAAILSCLFFYHNGQQNQEIDKYKGLYNQYLFKVDYLRDSLPGVDSVLQNAQDEYEDAQDLLYEERIKNNPDITP